MAFSASLFGAMFLICAALTDLKWRIISNRIVLLVLLAGIVLRLTGGVPALLCAAMISGFIFAAMLLLFHLGAVGGGDVKFLAAATLLSAPDEVGSQLVLIALAGGVMALMFLLWRACLRLYRKNSIPTERGVMPADHAALSLTAVQQNEGPGFHGDGLPYGVAICIGTLANMALSK